MKYEVHTFMQVYETKGIFAKICDVGGNVMAVLLLNRRVIKPNERPYGFEIAPSIQYALSFDGSDDYVSVSNTGQFDLSSVTIKTRFRVFKKNATGLMTIYNQQEGSYNTRSFVIWVDEGGAHFNTNAIVARSIDNLGQPIQVQTSGKDYIDGEWHNVELIVVQGEKMELWVGGVLQDTYTGNAQPILNNLPITFGAENGATKSRYLNGDISYVEVINTSSGSTTVAHWDFSDGSGTTLSDISGNSNNGTITGATWTEIT